MEYLNINTAKKGDIIYIVSPWNHIFNNNREQSTDSYKVKKATIASIGKKLMRLDVEGEPLQDQHRADWNGNFLVLKNHGKNLEANAFAWLSNDIVDTTLKMRAIDDKCTHRYVVLNKTFRS